MVTVGRSCMQGANPCLTLSKLSSSQTDHDKPDHLGAGRYLAPYHALKERGGDDPNRHYHSNHPIIRWRIRHWHDNTSNI